MGLECSFVRGPIILGDFSSEGSFQPRNSIHILSISQFFENAQNSEIFRSERQILFELSKSLQLNSNFVDCTSEFSSIPISDSTFGLVAAHFSKIQFQCDFVEAKSA